MKWFEKLLILLVPTLKIRPRWKTLWDQKDRQAFVVGARITFSFFLAAYLLHYYLIDLPLKKEPIELWAKYRFGLSAIAVVGLALTYVKNFQASRYYRLPLALGGLAFSLLQAQSMIWRAEVPYVYSIIIPVIMTVALRKSIFESLLYLALTYAAEMPAWGSRPQEMPYILSAAIVGAIFVSVIRSRMSSDVDAFVSQQEQIDTKHQLIESQRELNEQVRAFLPIEIYNRISILTQKEKKSVLEAMDEVLRPRQKIVTCIFSDIRGYTQLTKSASGFIQSSALPNMKACTAVVEQYSGIPRLTGDLIFAYFDRRDIAASFQQGLLCSFDLTKKNIELNRNISEDKRVKRHVILSFGQAIVGNIGGTDASREITVLGDPANILSRIDPITKDERIRPYLEQPAVILTRLSADLAKKLFPEIQMNPIDLSSIGISLRDFPEEKTIWVLPVTDANRARISDATKLKSVQFVQEEQIEETRRVA